MPNTKISALPEITTLLDADLCPITQAGTTSRVTWANIKAFLLSGFISLFFASEYNNGNSGASKTIDWKANGNKQKITTTASCTLTFTAPDWPANVQLKVIHEASATAYTYTYPATVKWSWGVPPTTNTSGAVDIISFYFDGTNYYGAWTLNFS